MGSDGAFRRLQPPPLPHAACSLLKTLERVIPRQHGLPKSPCACPMSTRVWGLREYLGFDFGRPHYTSSEQAFVIVGFLGLLCRVGRCGIFVTPASGLLGMWSLRGGRAMETDQEMRMCVRDWRKTSTDSRTDGFCNIQYIQILLVSFPDNFFFPQQVVLYLFFPLSIGSSKAGTRNDAVLSNRL